MEFRIGAGSIVAILVLLGCSLGGQASVYEGCLQEVDVKSFLSEICDTSSPLLSVTVKSFDVDHIDRSLEHVCKEGAHGLLLWIKSTNFEDVPEVDTNLRYIGRAFSEDGTEKYCTYDPESQVCSNGEETYESAMILGEKYPERYELKDIVYSKWTNTTRLGSPVLSYVTLKNREGANKYIDQDISYVSDTRLDFILPSVVIHGLPLSVFRSKVDIYRTISGETYYGRAFKTINAVRYMSPGTAINVTVVGTEERSYREFRAKLISVYIDEEGFGWANSLLSIEGTAIETSLAETHVEYGAVTNLYEESLIQPGAPTLSPSIPHTDHKYPGEALLSQAEPSIHVHLREHGLEQVYPGFRTYAVGAGILFFSVVGVALLDILRRIISERRAKRLRIGKYSKYSG